MMQRVKFFSISFLFFISFFGAQLPAQTVQTFIPSDDAFVRSANPTGNYGSHTVLRVRRPHSDEVISFLKFNVTGLTGAVQHAKLRLYVEDGSVDGGAIYSVSNNLNGSATPWTQSALIYNNAPAVGGSPFSSLGAVAIGSEVEFDVAAAIAGDGVYSFAIANQHNDLATYASKEGSQPPQLLIETGGAAPAAPVISSFTPSSGPAETAVTIIGNHFVNMTQVLFNGAAAGFTVDSPTQVRATVPSGASSGAITVTTSAGAAVSASAFTVTQPPAGGGSVSFSPTDDSFVRSNNPTNNYGGANELRVRKSSSADFITYLKFNVAGLTASVQQAKIRLRVIDESADGGAIFSVSNNFKGTTTPWNEDNLDFNNAPTLSGSPLSSLGGVALGETVEFDVAAAVTGNGVYSFAIRSAANDLANYSSKEGVQSPQLVIQMSGDSPPPPPAPAPTITSFSPTSGAVGSEVTIAGSGFTGVTGVAFNGAAAVSFLVSSTTQIRAVVSSNATSGPISVSNSSGAGTSAQNFIVSEPEPEPEPEPDPSPSGTFTFHPVEDAFIRSNYPTNNYGGADELRVRKSSSTDFISYLKFNVSGLSGAVQRATLRLLVIDASVDGGAIYSVSNNFSASSSPWNEDNLNATNAPAVAGSPLSLRGAVNLNEVVEFDVTAVISGDGVYSFAIKTNANDLANYSSKEGAQIPELLIETGEGSSTLPSIASFSPASGGAGTEVTIVGANFVGATGGGTSGTIRIMPLGDSITQGVHGSTDNAGYRNDLAELLGSSGVSYNFVGTRNHGSGFDADHEGHSGYRADEILAELNSYLTSNPPDMILLHIGSNDMSELQTPASTVNEISAILDAIKAFDASIVTILASVIPRSDSKNGATNTLNNDIRDLIPVKQNSGHNVFYAGMNEAFVANSSWSTQYLADSVHPNDAGYGVMAGVWLDAILSTLGISPNLTVRFNGAVAAAVAVDSENQLRAQVPAGATSGKISVTTAFGTGFSASDFVVTSSALTFKTTASQPLSLMEMEQMVLGKLSFDPRGDFDGSGGIDLADVFQLTDGDGHSAANIQFSKQELSKEEAASAFRLIAGEKALVISPMKPVVLRGFFIHLKFDPAKIRFSSPLELENKHNLLIRSHVGDDFVTLIGYLKKAGQSVFVEDVVVNLPVEMSAAGWTAEDMFIHRAMLVAPATQTDKQTELESEPLPTEFALFQNYPNPFNAGTEIKFNLPERTRAALKIFNIRGELVRTLFDEERAPGQYRLHWDGKDDRGVLAASGVYVYRLQTPRWDAARKLTMVK